MKKEQFKNSIDSPEKLVKLIKTNLIVVIKISAKWCGPCKDENFLDLYHKLKSNYSAIENIKFIEFDIDDDSDILEDKKYYDISINSVPSFLISKNGSFTKKYIGQNYLNDINDYIYNSIVV